jgi:hypothetical protein
MKSGGGLAYEIADMRSSPSSELNVVRVGLASEMENIVRSGSTLLACALALWMLCDGFLSEWFIARRPLDAILACQQTGSSPWRDPLWADTVIIVAQRHSGPYGVFTPLVHVCEQCATQKELDGAKTQVICPGCSRTLFVPYQWKAHRRRYCCEACGKRARRKVRRLKTHLCSVCKIEFRSARRDARFCSNACRQSRYRLRKAAV